MKKVKFIASAFAVLAIVGSALAFKATNAFGGGSVYCTSACSVLKNFKVDLSGTNTTPCGAGVQPYVLIGTNPPVCTATAAGTTFSGTAPGK